MANVYARLLALAMMGIFASEYPGGGSRRHEWEELTESERREIEAVRKRKIQEADMKKGLKKFTIDGYTVIALNEKNAIRKVKKLIEESKYQ